MRAMKAFATAVALSVGAISAAAILPATAVAQQPSLQAQLQAAVNSLPPNASVEQVAAAINGVLETSGATPAQKAAAVSAVSPPSNQPNAAAVISGTVTALNIIASTPPGTSQTAINQAIADNTAALSPAQREAALLQTRNLSNNPQVQTAANNASSGGAGGTGAGGTGSGSTAGGGAPSGSGSPGGGYTN